MEKKKFAVKCIKLSANDEEMAQFSTREVEVLSGLKHRNIVFYYNAWWENNPPPEWENSAEGYADEDSSVDSDDASSFDSRRIKEAEERYGNPSVTPSRSEQQSVSPLKRSLSRTSGIFSSEPTDQQSSRQRSSLFRLVSMAAEQLVSKKTSRSYIYLYIQMELCREENLAKWLKIRQPVELNVHQMYREILSAVKYLHSLELVHRDLKPSNIFFNFDWSIKVGDFGLSKRITAGESESSESESSPTTSSEGRQWDKFDQLNQTHYIGTKPYMAPEQESSNTYNHKVDVYALAIILFELLMGPFKTDSERIDLISRLKSFQLPPKLQDANIKQLLIKMLSVDPNKRPEVKDILSEHFQKEVKQLNPRPVKRQNSRPSVHTPIRHASDVFQSK